MRLLGRLPGMRSQPSLAAAARPVPAATLARVERESILPYLGLRAAELVLRAVDRRRAYLITGPLAAFLTVCWPSHWRGLQQNLEVVAPGLSRAQRRRLLRDNVRNFLKAWIDVLQMAHRPLEAWTPWLRIEDDHYLTEAKARGKGVIIVSLHLGSWEAAIAALKGHFSGSGDGLALLAEQVRPLRCFNWLVRAREKVGCQVIPLNVDAVRRGDQVAVHRSGAAAVRRIYRMLSQRGVVVIAIDRDLLGTGAAMPFLGRRASIPTGAVEIAARSGAAILPVVLTRDRQDNYCAKALPPFFVEETAAGDGQQLLAVRRLLRRLEPELTAHPDQWHVLNPIFGEPMAELPGLGGESG